MTHTPAASDRPDGLRARGPRPTVVRPPEAAGEALFQDLMTRLGGRMEPARVNVAALIREAQAVFRHDGRMVASLWRDGTTEITDPAYAGAFDGLRLHAEADAQDLDGQPRLDWLTDAIAGALGPAVTVERWDGAENAPTWRDYLEGRLFTAADHAFGRRPYRLDPAPPAQAGERVRDLWVLNLVREE
ncbi:MAG: hypothetical protein LDL26_09505 [Caenispirillum bisanense]|nr:hypothetical protein [Caenispirillum bisanense]MCA1974655.1 hypothetical protein [Caenispirillum sp.]